MIAGCVTACQTELRFLCQVLGARSAANKILCSFKRAPRTALSSWQKAVLCSPAASKRLKFHCHFATAASEAFICRVLLPFLSLLPPSAREGCRNTQLSGVPEDKLREDQDPSATPPPPGLPPSPLQGPLLAMATAAGRDGGAR